MNNQFKDYLIEKNFFWKVISLLIAFGLWFIVINTQNPEETRSYTTNLQVENYDVVTAAGLTVTNLNEIEESKVVVKVRGPRLSLDRLNDGDIIAVVDMSAVDFSTVPGTVTRNIETIISSSVDSLQIDSVSKRSVNIVMENLVSETRKVEINMKGTAGEGYNIVAESIYPSDITVSGAETGIKNVVGVRADVDITGQSADREIIVSPYAYDKDGNPVDGVFLSSYEVVAALKAYVSKSIPVEYTINEPHEGFSVEDVICSPSQLVVVGKGDALDALESIVLPNMDISDRTSNVQAVFYVDELLPEGIKTVDETEKITLDIRITSNSEKEIEFNISDIDIVGKRDGLGYSIYDGGYTLSFKGSEKNIRQLKKEDISVEVDVSGLEPDVHTVVPKIILPDNIMLSGDVPSLVVIVE